LKAGFYAIYFPASFVWRWLDRLASWGQTRFWIENIPSAIFTPATYCSYAGWMHNQGFFCGMLSLHLERQRPRIFDFGCGMGNLAPVAYHFVKDGGEYLGVDTDRVSIEACQRTYGKLRNVKFYRTSDQNACYAQGDAPISQDGRIDWPVGPISQDLVIAMSVFTHLQEPEAKKYMTKVWEVLSDGGLAVLSFHLIREHVSENPIYNFVHPLTAGWFTSNPACPELAVGLTRAALDDLLGGRFELLHRIEGSATGGKHPLLQDIFVLKKRSPTKAT